MINKNNYRFNLNSLYFNRLNIFKFNIFIIKLVNI